MVDFMRACYDTVMQFDVAGELTARVRWFFACEGAQMLPFQPHYFVTDTWEQDRNSTLGPGEVWNEPSTYYNGALPAPLYGRGAPCGPEDWWVNGCPSDAPRLTIGPNGAPTCCALATAFKAGISVGARIVPVFACQPWYTFVSPHRKCATTIGGSSPWVSQLQNAVRSDWNDETTLPWEIDFGDNGLSCSPGNAGTNVAIFHAGMAYAPTFVSYDPATFTGTWNVGSIPGWPYGAQIFATLPPT